MTEGFFFGSSLRKIPLSLKGDQVLQHIDNENENNA
jgi:hypothetical protein